MIDFEDLEKIRNKQVVLSELDSNLCDRCRFQFGNDKEIVKPFIITSQYGKTTYQWLACFCEWHAARIVAKEELTEKDIFTVRMLNDRTDT